MTEQVPTMQDATQPQGPVAPPAPQLAVYSVVLQDGIHVSVGFVLASSEKSAKQTAKNAYAAEVGRYPRVPTARPVPDKMLVTADSGEHYKVEVYIEAYEPPV